MIYVIKHIIRKEKIKLINDVTRIVRELLKQDFLQKQKKCKKNFGKHHIIYRRKTFPKSKSRKDLCVAYQQSQIPWIQFL